MNRWTRRSEWNRASAGPAAGPATLASHHYFAFLSYSHRDAEEADWLHGELERFRVPSSLAGRLTANGVIPKRMTPIFRDRSELAAGHDLTAEIRETLIHSRCLIVLCSPAAAVSKWTNAEIEVFKRAHPDGCIIAAIVAGEPFASEIPGREAEECFPVALRQKFDRRGRPTGRRAEPLAADLRETGDGHRRGLLKIVAGILGVGLDDLVQRDHIRRQRRLAFISTGSIAGMLIASFLAISAIQARDAARDQRREAEGLVEFMLGDLKDKLEPIGRLDVLDSVGAKALAYYQKQDPSQMSDDSLIQRSKALTLLGQVASTRGDLDGALGFYTAAFEGTAEALRREPDDAQRIYDHAQNVFYVGDIAHYRGQMPKAEASMREYKRLAEKLIAIDPTNPKWQMEGIYADTNIGVMLNDEGRFSEAAAVFENALVDRERLAKRDPTNPEFKRAFFEGLAWLAQAREDEGRLEDAVAVRERQIQLLSPIVADPRSDAEYQRQATVAYRAAGRVNAMLGKPARGVEQLHSGLQIADRMTAAEPTNTVTLGRAAWLRLELARVELASGATEESTRLIREGCDLTNRLIAKDPTVEEWRLDLRTTCGELQARSALSQGQTAEAEAVAGGLVRAVDSERVRSDSQKAQLSAATAHMVQGLVWRAQGKGALALSAFRRAAASLPQQPSDKPARLAQRIVILAAIGRPAEAQSLAQRLKAMGYRDPIYLRDLRSVT